MADGAPLELGIPVLGATAGYKHSAPLELIFQTTSHLKETTDVMVNTNTALKISRRFSSSIVPL